MEIVPHIIVSLLAIVFGQLVSHLNKKLPPVVSEEITYKEFFKSVAIDFKVDFKYTILFLIIYNALLQFSGNTLKMYLYLIVIATLAIVTSVDIRYKLIPDETHIIIVICGLINLVFNISSWYDYILGALIGGAIFYLINIMALLILKKEGMGLGDVKLMASLGFLFGIKNILVIALLSFLIGAIIGILILICKRKEKNVYMAFGPFIAIAAVILMFVEANYVIELYVLFCSFLGNKMTDLIYFFMKK